MISSSVDFFLYIINESDTTFPKLEKLLSKHTNTEVGDKMSALAEQLVEKGKIEGRREGKVEGKVEGKIEGKREGKIDVALNLIKEGTDPKFVAKVTQLTEKQMDDLLKRIEEHAVT